MAECCKGSSAYYVADAHVNASLRPGAEKSTASRELMLVLAEARRRAEGPASIATHHDGVGAELVDQACGTPVSFAVNSALQDLVAWAEADLCCEGELLVGSSAPQVPDVIVAEDNQQLCGAEVCACLPELPPLQSELGQWALWKVQCEQQVPSCGGLGVQEALEAQGPVLEALGPPQNFILNRTI